MVVERNKCARAGICNSDWIAARAAIIGGENGGEEIGEGGEEEREGGEEQKKKK